MYELMMLENNVRDIRFRVWDKNQEKMIDVKYLEYDNTAVNQFKGRGCLTSLSFRVGIGEESYRNISDVAIMQYTGLKDMNGKEIYEGDIVNFKNFYFSGDKEFWATGVVEFDNASYMIKGRYSDAYRWKDYTVEVVGNIYENDDLLPQLLE